MKYFVKDSKINKEEYDLFIRKCEAYNITYNVRVLNNKTTIYFNITNFLEKVNRNDCNVREVISYIDDTKCTETYIDAFLDKHDQDFEMSVVFTTRDRSYVNKEIKIYIM